MTASDPVDAASIRAQLERILASAGFVNATRLSRFLRFLVERTLDGRGDEIKEYVLGTEVFDRGSDYDPRLDSIVRVEASRLRSKLEEYYRGPGTSDRVAIVLRRGSYVPSFEMRRADAPPPVARSSNSDPSGVVSAPPERQTLSRHGHRLWAIAVAVALTIAIAVLAFRALGTTTATSPRVRVAILPATHHPAGAAMSSLAERITDGITSSMVRLQRFEIVSRTSTRQYAAGPRRVRAIAESLGADWIVEISVVDDGGVLRVETRIVDPIRDRKVWVGETTGAPADLRDIEARAARDLDAALSKAQR